MQKQLAYRLCSTIKMIMAPFFAVVCDNDIFIDSFDS